MRCCGNGLTFLVLEFSESLVSGCQCGEKRMVLASVLCLIYTDAMTVILCKVNPLDNPPSCNMLLGSCFVQSSRMTWVWKRRSFTPVCQTFEDKSTQQPLLSCIAYYPILLPGLLPSWLCVPEDLTCKSYSVTLKPQAKASLCLFVEVCLSVASLGHPLYSPLPGVLVPLLGTWGLS